MRDPRLTEIDALKIRFSQIFVAMAVGAIAAQVSHLSGGAVHIPKPDFTKIEMFGRSLSDDEISIANETWDTFIGNLDWAYKLGGGVTHEKGSPTVH